MSNKNSYALSNKAWWENLVKDKKCGFTKPWLDLDVKVLKRLAKGKLKNPPEPLNDIYPISVLANVKNKDVLCLASGGGQQSAVFGLLGARVTVLDIAEGQLEQDKKAAAHYGYAVKTVPGDMSDLSAFKDASFDFVYQAPSMSYVPDVKKVYCEVARVLRKGGLYRADAHNPQAQFIDESSWDARGYRISVPYALKQKRRSAKKNVIEYRHYLSEAFNGLIECGFAIERVEETPRGLYQTRNDKPGSWGHSLRYIPGMFTILARKK